jgi:predicted Fe-Mo cluster-binding NifX family protein
MKIAIPLFGSRVSPRFGCEPEILIVDIEEHKEINRRKFSTMELGIPQRISLLSSLCVDTLICGGIDTFCLRSLSAKGFQIIPGVIGEADEALNYFLSGELREGQCLRRGKRFRGGGRPSFSEVVHEVTTERSEHNRKRKNISEKKR